MSLEDHSASETKECPYCCEDIKAAAQKCRYCGEILDESVRRQQNQPSASERFLLPVGRPASAIAAGYFGLFAAIPLPFGIAAIIFGVIALKAIKENPELSGKGRAIFGIISGTIFTLLYGVMFLTLLLS